jgi:hypothetical protein
MAKCYDITGWQEVAAEQGIGITFGVEDKELREVVQEIMGEGNGNHPVINEAAFGDLLREVRAVLTAQIEELVVARVREEAGRRLRRLIELETGTKTEQS